MVKKVRDKGRLLKVTVVLALLAFLAYCYLSFDFAAVATNSAVYYDVLRQFGVPEEEAFIMAVRTAYGGIVGDIGAFMKGYPTSRDILLPYLIVKFMSYFYSTLGAI